MVCAASLGVHAQSGPVGGTVEIQNADGTRTPFAGALVEAFRSDIKASSPPAKTNARGQFSFAGLQAGWIYILSISGTGIAPTYMPNVRPGQEKILITVVPGGGQKLTEDEVKTAAKSPAGTAPVDAAAAKKAQAEFEVQKKAVEEKNAKATKTNDIAGRAINEGKAAFEARNWDLAIAKYEEGYQADPVFIGSAPIFLRNKGIALTERAVETHNKGVRMTEAAERQAAAEKVRADLTEAAKSFKTAWTLLKDAPAAERPENFEASKTGVLTGSIQTFRRAVDTEKTTPELVEAAKTIVPEYLAVETDGAKKAAASLVLADIYRVNGDSENAIAAYQSILATSPDNQDAMVGAGLSLVNLGFMKDDKSKMQEGANILAKFASIAPDSNKYKADAIALIDSLKREQNVTADKKAVTSGKKKP